MPGLDLSKIPMDMIMNFINIILIYIIVHLLLYKPVRKFLDARAKKTADTMNEAQRAKDDAQKLKADYEALISDSRSQAKELIKEGEIKAAQKADSIIEDAKAKAQSIIEEAQKQIAHERMQAQEDVKNEIVRTALIISQKVLEREIKDDDVKKIAEDYFVNPKGKTV